LQQDRIFPFRRRLKLQSEEQERKRGSIESFNLPGFEVATSNADDQLDQISFLLEFLPSKYFRMIVSRGIVRPQSNLRRQQDSLSKIAIVNVNVDVDVV